MAKTIPANYTPVDGIEFRTRRPIRAIDWQKIVEDQNLIYSRIGEKFSGRAWNGFFSTNSAVYTYVNSGFPNLDDWQPVFISRKRTSESAGFNSSFNLQVFGRSYDLLWELIDADTGGVVKSGTIVNNLGTKLWSDDFINLDWDESTWLNPNYGPDYKIFILSVKVRASGGTAEIVQINLRPKVLDATELPSANRDWELFAQPIRTFTNCSATGRYGPNQSQADAEYALTSLKDEVTIIGFGVQQWRVPVSGTWRIEAYGAGFNAVGIQRGARMRGDFVLNAGDYLRILVGQVGSNVRCGSGGTFVAKYDISTGSSMVPDTIKVTPLIIAGGAGGTLTSGNAAIQGTINNNGQNSSTGALGGTGGAGGAGVGFAIGGAGWSGNGGGSDGISPNNATRSFLNGGWGNLTSETIPTQGSWGGGGTGRPTTNYRFGGGGGYSGGAAAQTTSSTGYGGGGGSYNIGTTQSNSSGSNSGHGKVIITFIG